MFCIWILHLTLKYLAIYGGISSISRSYGYFLRAIALQLPVHSIQSNSNSSYFQFRTDVRSKMHDKYALHFVVYVARIDQGLDNRIVRRLAKKLVYYIVIPMNECSKSMYSEKFQWPTSANIKFNWIARVPHSLWASCYGHKRLFTWRTFHKWILYFGKLFLFYIMQLLAMSTVRCQDKSFLILSKWA